MLEESRIKINYFKNYLKFNTLMSSNINYLVKKLKREHNLNYLLASYFVDIDKLNIVYMERQKTRITNKIFMNNKERGLALPYFKIDNKVTGIKILWYCESRQIYQCNRTESQI